MLIDYFDPLIIQIGIFTLYHWKAWFVNFAKRYNSYRSQIRVMSSTALCVCSNPENVPIFSQKFCETGKVKDR